jgi:aspartyl-tRNA synthetase
MVLNGNEIGGGSIRIHDKATQQLMFKYWVSQKNKPKNSLGSEWIFSLEHPTRRTSFWIRSIAILGGQETIRDFIASSKNNSGRDVMIDAPSSIDESQLKSYI